MIRILHLETNYDHFRLTEHQLVERNPDVSVSQVQTIPEAMSAIETETFHCVLGDDTDPDNGLLSLLRFLRKEDNCLPCVIFTDKDEIVPEGFAQSYYGSDEFNVCICFGNYDLANHWIHVLVERYLLSSRSSDQTGTNQEIHPASESIAGLSDREKEVLGLIAQGLSNKEIAFELNLSYHTVTKHVSNLFAKLDIHSRAEAIRLAIEHNVKV